MRRYAGIRALKRVSAQFVGGGLNRDLTSLCIDLRLAAAQRKWGSYSVEDGTTGIR
jgi:hypothetical protein